jgi:hypothetical protein
VYGVCSACRTKTHLRLLCFDVTSNEHKPLDTNTLFSCDHCSCALSSIAARHKISDNPVQIYKYLQRTFVDPPTVAMIPGWIPLTSIYMVPRKGKLMAALSEEYQWSFFGYSLKGGKSVLLCLSCHQSSKTCSHRVGLPRILAGDDNLDDEVLKKPAKSDSIHTDRMISSQKYPCKLLCMYLTFSEILDGCKPERCCE